MSTPFMYDENQRFICPTSDWGFKRILGEPQNKRKPPSRRTSSEAYEKTDIAKAMKAEGMSSDLISKITGLPKEQVEAL